MLLNNYSCAINYSEYELKKTVQKFLMRLLDKDYVEARPSAKEALEDDVFCLADSAVNVNMDFMDGKYLRSDKSEFDK